MSEGEKKMGTIATDHSEPKAMPEVLASPEKPPATPKSVDKFAEARRAKKKQRRVTHRNKLKRSNTGG
jgi:hypothetical protein